MTAPPSDPAAAVLRRAQVIAEQLHEEAVREAERATAEAHRLEAEQRTLHDRAEGHGHPGGRPGRRRRSRCAGIHTHGDHVG